MRRSERFANIGSYGPVVVVPFKIASAFTLFADATEDAAQLRLVGIEPTERQRAETFFDDGMQPGVESDGECALLVAQPLTLGIDLLSGEVLLGDENILSIGEELR